MASDPAVGAVPVNPSGVGQLHVPPPLRVGAGLTSACRKPSRPPWRTEIQSLKAQGGIGSTLATFWLNWINQAMTAHKVTRFARALLLPAWLLLSLITNTVGLILDWIDHTKAFYGNTFVIARKKSSDH